MVHTLIAQSIPIHSTYTTHISLNINNNKLSNTPTGFN